MIIPRPDGTPAWAVLLTTYMIDEEQAFANISSEVLAIAATREEAEYLEKAFMPHLPLGGCLAIQETVMADLD